MLKLKANLPVLITPVEVEARVERALKTLWALPDRERSWLGARANWPFATIDDRADLNAQAENAAELKEMEALRLARFKPSPADVAQMHEALAWFNALGLTPKVRQQLIAAGRLPLSPEQWLVWWRAKGLSYANIARRINKSDETARTRYANAIHICWQHANLAANARLRRDVAAARASSR